MLTCRKTSNPAASVLLLAEKTVQPPTGAPRADAAITGGQPSSPLPSLSPFSTPVRSGHHYSSSISIGGDAINGEAMAGDTQPPDGTVPLFFTPYASSIPSFPRRHHSPLLLRSRRKWRKIIGITISSEPPSAQPFVSSFSRHICPTNQSVIASLPLTPTTG